MDYQEAWAIVEAQFEDTEPEIANELDDCFVFYLKPKGAPPGIITGIAGILVDKKTKKMSSVYPSDPRLRKSKTMKIYSEGKVYLEL
jgi:hypothetical protein